MSGATMIGGTTAGSGMRALIERARDERGSSQVLIILSVVALIVVIGLVVDGAGQVQARTNAQHVAASAARAAVSAIGGDTVDGATLAVDSAAAEFAAREQLEASGLTGTVDVTGAVVTVTVTDVYRTAFLSLIGIESLNVTASASASLIDGPDAPVGEPPDGFGDES
ncbi:MAG: pilus assembly protein TadG-related protein [Pseudoclavibacter sp.]